MTTQSQVLVQKEKYTKKKDKKHFVSVSTHVVEDDLLLIKRVLAKEKTTIYAFLKKCLMDKVEPYKIDNAMGLPPIPTEDDLLG
jgi:hypothetical protein